MTKHILRTLVLCGALVIVITTFQSRNTKEETYRTYCGGCHIAPEIETIPKEIWKNHILPEMGARMGIQVNEFRLKRYSYEESFYVNKANVYPDYPTLDSTTWTELYEYILSKAPDSVELPKQAQQHPLTQLDIQIADEQEAGRGFTHISLEGSYLVSATEKALLKNSRIEKSLKTNSPVTSYEKYEGSIYLTEIGIMDPSEIPRGIIRKINGSDTTIIYNQLHGPVFTKAADLNGDGQEEIIICEFGHHTGALSMLVETNGTYEKRILYELPGSIKVDIEDLDGDGRKDIIALFGQAYEGIYIFYQQDNLTFKLHRPISFQPQFGTSWFELIDFNKDGSMDILLTHGDNADYSIFPKPFHGLRLYLNDGNNQFTKEWFIPIQGATQVETDDFDADGDSDIAVISFFADLETPSFTYLENIGKNQFKHASSTVMNPSKWLVMDKGDFDQDGDMDLVLGEFDIYNQNNQARMAILKNTLFVNHTK